MTRLGDFWKFLTTSFLKKVAQIFGDLFANFENHHHCLIQTSAAAFWANCSAAVIVIFMDTFHNRDDLVTTSIFLGILHFEQFSDGVWAMSSERAWDNAVCELINRFFHDI